MIKHYIEPSFSEFVLDSAIILLQKSDDTSIDSDGRDGDGDEGDDDD